MRGGCGLLPDRLSHPERAFLNLKGIAAAGSVCHCPKPRSPVKPSLSLPTTDSSPVELASNRGIRIPTICVTGIYGKGPRRFRSFERLVFFGGIFTVLVGEGWTKGRFRLIILWPTEPADIKPITHKQLKIRCLLSVTSIKQIFLSQNLLEISNIHDSERMHAFWYVVYEIAKLHIR